MLRAAQLDQSLFGDELFLHAIVTRDSLGDVLSEVHDTESTPPLHFVLAWLSVKLTDPELGVRLPSLLAGTALVPAVFALGRRTVGVWPGLIGAAVVAVAPYGVMYGVEGRASSLLALLSCLSTLALLHALDRGGVWRWVGFGALTAAILYTHYTGVFVVVAQGAWALWRHRAEWRAIALSYAGVALVYLPWIPSFFVQRRDSAAVRIDAAYALTPENIATGVLKVVPGHPFFDLPDLPGRFSVAVFIVAVLAAVVVAVVRSDIRRPSRPVELLAVIALASPVAAVLYSLGPESVYLPRNLISSWPAAVLLLGLALIRAGRVAGGVAGVAVFAVLLFGTAKTFDSDFERPGYRAAAEAIEERGDPGDAVLDVPAGIENPLTQSMRAHLDESYVLVRAGGDERAVRARAAERGRLFVVVPQAGALAGREPRGLPPGLRLVDRQEFGGFVPIALFVYERP